MRQRVGHVRDQRAGLRVHLASLQAEAAVDAVRPVAERAVGDAHRADAHLDPRGPRALPSAPGGARDRMRAVRVAVRIAPRPVLAGDGQLALDALVVRLELVVRIRPVGADAVFGLRAEVGRMEPRRVAGVVDHRAADAMAGVVLAQLDVVAAADDPLVGPVDRVRAGLVGDPVAVRVPERPLLEHDDAPALAGEPLREQAAAGAAADDRDVDLVVVAVAGHRARLRDRAAVHVEQLVGVVSGGVDGPLEEQPPLHRSTSRRRTSSTGSSSNASSPSHCSVSPAPSRLYPRGYAGPGKPISLHDHGCE